MRREAKNGRGNRQAIAQIKIAGGKYKLKELQEETGGPRRGGVGRWALGVGKRTQLATEAEADSVIAIYLQAFCRGWPSCPR